MRWLALLNQKHACSAQLNSSESVRSFGGCFQKLRLKFNNIALLGGCVRRVGGARDNASKGSNIRLLKIEIFLSVIFCAEISILIFGS